MPDATCHPAPLSGGNGLPAEAADWLRTGERGASSEALFAYFSGLDVLRASGSVAPADPFDVRRCRLLLEAVPEWAGRLDEMSAVSLYWRRLVTHWRVICEVMDDEAPDWRERDRHLPLMPRTYDLMQHVLRGHTRPHRR